MARYECERCKAICFTTDPPHLCRDVRKRMERQEKQLEAVMYVLSEMSFWSETDYSRLEAAEEIVTRLNQLNIHQD